MRIVVRILCLILFFWLLGGTLSQSQISDDTLRKRELFLKTREQMRTLPPEPTPTPRPKPRVTPRPKPTPEETPEETPTPKPRRVLPVETPEETPTPRSTPEETPAPTPERTATPKLTPSATATPRTAATPAPTPTPTPQGKPTPRPFFPSREAPQAPITIRKSGSEETEVAPVPRSWWGGPKYRYITGSVKKGIDNAPVKRGRWKYIVVHNSGTRQGSAKIFDFYHRHTRKMPNGMAYHFVIGNGTSTGDGQIELGGRWIRQINGGHVHSDYLNYISLGICLVGDFNRDRPTTKQLEALDELIRYLRSRCGKVEGRYSIVRAHKEINPVPTDCPGDRFPVSWLHRRFD